MDLPNGAKQAPAAGFCVSHVWYLGLSLRKVLQRIVTVSELYHIQISSMDNGQVLDISGHGCHSLS